MASTDTRPSAIRIGAVRYLNAWPLTFFLERFAPAAEVVVDFPAGWPTAAAGELDVALIPSIEYWRNPGCTIVSDACIASDGAVRSVKLHSRVPLERIGSLALDEGSRTSAALVQIWLKDRMGLTPELRPLPIGASPADCQADAVMLIGDRGMRPAGGNLRLFGTWAQEWTRWTGLPFVFALWVARPGVELDAAGPRRSPRPATRASLACRRSPGRRPRWSDCRKPSVSRICAIIWSSGSAPGSGRDSNAFTNWPPDMGWRPAG